MGIRAELWFGCEISEDVTGRLMCGWMKWRDTKRSHLKVKGLTNKRDGMEKVEVVKTRMLRWMLGETRVDKYKYIESNT